MNYKKIIQKIHEYQNNPPYSIPFSHSKLNRALNGVERGKYTVIAGRANSGKTSFVDFYYVISLFDTYLQTEPSQRKPFHILYFELKDSEEKKLMKWMASYMFMKYKTLVDINTFRNTTGKAFTFDEEREEALYKSQDFFKELSDHMTMFIKPMNSTDIYIKIKNYMESVGGFHDGIFQYDKEHEDQITLVVINNTARIRTELDSYDNQLERNAINEKINDYMQELIDKYRISPVVVHPIRDMGNIGKGAPELKHLEIYGSTVDQGLIMYNPFNYGNKDYLGYNIPEFVIGGKNRFTSVTVMKNNTGIDHASVGLIFLGEASYFGFCPLPSQEIELADKLGTLRTID